MGSDLAIGCTAPTAGIWFLDPMEQMKSMTPDGLGRCGHTKAGGQTVQWMEQPAKTHSCPERKPGTGRSNGTAQTRLTHRKLRNRL